MAGDCIGNRSDGGNPYRFDAALMQSRRSSIVSERRRLVSGAGFTTIYCTDKTKIEISAQGKYLRMTKFRDGQKKGERLYIRISDERKKRRIEDLSENWHLCVDGDTYGYYVLQQQNAHNKPTGYYKIIRKEKAELLGSTIRVMRARSEDDWIHYGKKDKVYEI